MYLRNRTAATISKTPVTIAHGSIVGTCSFIGPLTGAVLILVVAAFSGFAHLLWLVIFLIAYRLFQDYVLNPLLMSSGVQLNPSVRLDVARLARIKRR